MEKIIFNHNWNFSELVSNIEVIKYQIKGIIASFSYYELKDQVKFKKNVRDAIYNFGFVRWRCDKILEYIYDDIDYETLKKLI